MRRADLAILGNRDFARLFTARTVSSLGSSLAPVAMAFGVLTLPGGGASGLGLVLAFSAAAQVVGVLVGGVAGDRLGPVRVAVWSEVVSGGVQATTAALFISGHATVALLAALAFVGSFSGAVFFPVSTALVPAVVPDGQLQAANGLLRLTGNVARILGAALGGLLVAGIGSGLTLGLDAVSYLGAAVVLTRLRTPYARAAADRGPTSLLRDMRDGWSTFIGLRWVPLVVASFTLANIGFAAALSVLGPLRAVQDLGGPAPWGVLLAAFSAGTIGGVLVAVRLRPRRPVAVACLLILGEVPFLAGLAVNAPFGVLLAAAVVCGLATDSFQILWDTAIQRHVPADMLARISAYDWFGSLLAVPLGLVLAGPMVVRVGLDTSLWICALFVCAPVLTVVFPSVRAVRDAGPPAGDSHTPRVVEG